MYYKILEIHSLTPASGCFMVESGRGYMPSSTPEKVCLFALLTIQETKLGVESVYKKVVPITCDEVHLLVVGGNADKLRVGDFKLSRHGV